MRRAIGNERSAMMLETPVSRLILRMALPSIVAQLITTIYALADVYFVSALGTAATAAVGVNASLDRCITMVGALLGNGAGSYIARLLGAKRKGDADRVLSTAALAGASIGVAMMAAGLPVREKLVYFLGATEDCAVYSMQYAQYVLIAAPFMIGTFLLSLTLRNEGSATFSMLGLSLGGLLNIALDPVFIFALDLGVAGASMATAISKLFSFCVLLYPYLRKKSAASLALRSVRFVGKDAAEVVSIGSASFFRTAGLVFSTVVLNRVAGGFSTAALAAMSVGNRVMEFPFSVILGFGGGYQPVVGFNWGAKRYDRVRESLRFGTAVSVLGCIAMGGLIFLFARQIIGLFNKEADAEVLRLGMLCVRAQCIAMPAHAWVSLINMFYAGAGKAPFTILLSTGRSFYCFVPLLLTVPRFFGAEGLACCLALADGLALLVCGPVAAHAYRLLRRAEADRTAPGE